MVGSLTVLPAVLSKLGDRVEKGRVPFIGKLKRSGRRVAGLEGGARPRDAAAACCRSSWPAALLVALAIPAFSMKTALPGIDTLPRDIEVMQTYDRIQAAFPGERCPPRWSSRLTT